MNSESAEDFDFAIIGAGSAGCVLADRLSANGRYSVIVLEAGGMDSSPVVRIPAAVLFTAGNPQFDWCFSSEPDPTRHNKSDAWPRGRVVGGSSSTNGQLYVRGQPADYDRWAALGNTDWDYTRVLPYFKQLESYTGADEGDFRGLDGALRVSAVRGPHLLSEAFVKAAADIGIPEPLDYNGPSQLGAAIAQATQKRGWRHSSARAFLHPNLHRKNLTLRTQAMVQRVEIEDGRAKGVTYLHKGSRKAIRVHREVILTAGAIGSPHLLMLSGVGAEDHLSEQGIATQRHLPGVGQNLQEHVGVWVVHGVKEGIRTLNMDFNLAGGLKHGLRFLLTGSGPIASPTAQAVAFVKSSDSVSDPDIQIHFTPLGYQIDGDAVTLMDRPAMLCVANVSNPESRGEIKLNSHDASVAPRILPRLLNTTGDVERLIAGCRIVRDIFAAPSLAQHALSELFPGQDVQSDEQWESLLRKAAGPVFHVVGTCKMGQDDLSVVDSKLRVHGVSGLRVADASIMPTITSGNTNAPTMMIAAKAADYILGSSSD